MTHEITNDQVKRLGEGLKNLDDTFWLPGKVAELKVEANENGPANVANKAILSMIDKSK